MPDPTKPSPDPWNNNNLACTDTWGYLFKYEELNVGFFDAPDVKMSELAFFVSTGSPGMLDAAALELAARLNRAFLNESRAHFETGWTEPKAVDAMKTILKDKDKTVRELAVKVDEIYNFSREKTGSSPS
jgi:hypothetical protein